MKDSNNIATLLQWTSIGSVAGEYRKAELFALSSHLVQVPFMSPDYHPGFPHLQRGIPQISGHLSRSEEARVTFSVRPILCDCRSKSGWEEKADCRGWVWLSGKAKPPLQSHHPFSCTIKDKTMGDVVLLSVKTYCNTADLLHSTLSASSLNAALSFPFPHRCTSPAVQCALYASSHPSPQQRLRKHLYGVPSAERCSRCVSQDMTKKPLGWQLS